MHELATLLDRLVPEALEPILRRILGVTMPRLGEGERYRIQVAGRFSGRLIGDVLTQMGNGGGDGALVLVEEDVHRVLYVAGGLVAGADSSVLFERLGRLLGQAGALDDESVEHVVAIEERDGAAAAAALLPGEAADWAIEYRIREVVAALYLMPRGHYVFVEGPPELGSLRTFALSPVELAVEGMRRYDEWRNRSARARPSDEALRILHEAQD